MQAIRSVLFHLSFYLTTAGYLLACLPLLALPRRFITIALRSYGRSCTWLLAKLARVETRFEGLDRLPADRTPLILASKHQSAFETFALFPLLADPVIILKAELMWLPVHGWFSLKMRMIPVRRGRGAAEIKRLLARARQRMAEGRQLIIFPEGTRRPVGAPPHYRKGIVALYENLNVPVYPVALNSGVHWPRKSMILTPGTITVKILPPIAPGLPADEFKQRLTSAIETASNALVAANR